MAAWRGLHYNLTGDRDNVRIAWNVSKSPTIWQGLDNVQEGEQEPFDFVLAQSADGRRGTAAQGGATSVQLR